MVLPDQHGNDIACRPDRTHKALILVFLLAPAAYLQCGSLAVGLFGMWTLGALVGATGGMFGGLEIRQTWLRRAAA